MYPEYPYKSHYLPLNESKLHYIDEGQGPVVLMIHGNPTWSYYYRNLISTLSKTNRVIAVDHMGCGLSDKPQDYNYCLEKHISNLEKLVTKLQIENFSMIVHDWGGAIGFGLAVNHITSIEKIVVLNTAAFRSKRIPFRISICRFPIIGEILVRLFNGFAWPALSMAVSKKMPVDIAQAYIAPYNSWSNRVAVYNFVKDIPLNANHKSYRVLLEIEEKLIDLRNQNIPMKIIWGGKDFCFNDHFFSEWRTRFPDAQHHYFGDAGHYVIEDKKNEVDVLLREFFKL